MNAKKIVLSVNYRSISPSNCSENLNSILLPAIFKFPCVLLIFTILISCLTTCTLQHPTNARKICNVSEKKCCIHVHEYLMVLFVVHLMYIKSIFTGCPFCFPPCWGIYILFSCQVIRHICVIVNNNKQTKKKLLPFSFEQFRHLICK